MSWSPCAEFGNWEPPPLACATARSPSTGAWPISSPLCSSSAPGRPSKTELIRFAAQFLEERQDGATLQLTADEHLAGGINAVDLED
jgi:hypothetical protein